MADDQRPNLQSTGDMGASTPLDQERISREFTILETGPAVPGKVEERPSDQASDKGGS